MAYRSVNNYLQPCVSFSFDETNTEVAALTGLCFWRHSSRHTTVGQRESARVHEPLTVSERVCAILFLLRMGSGTWDHFTTALGRTPMWYAQANGNVSGWHTPMPHDVRLKSVTWRIRQSSARLQQPAPCLHRDSVHVGILGRGARRGTQRVMLISMWTGCSLRDFLVHANVKIDLKCVTLLKGYS